MQKIRVPFLGAGDRLEAFIGLLSPVLLDSLVKKDDNICNEQKFWSPWPAVGENNGESPTNTDQSPLVITEGFAL